MPAWWRIWARKFRVAGQQSGTVLALVPVAWLAIGIAAAAIALRPFRHLAPWLGQNLGAVALCPLVGPQATIRAKAIADAIGIAARNAPFRSNCLPQAMAAVFLCKRAGLPYAVHLGAIIDDTAASRSLKAHAWVECGAITVTGGADSLAKYGSLACFAALDGGAGRA